MVNVGLTGGIATGKSTVAGMLLKKGASLIDFDLLAREAAEPGRPAWRAIVDFFGEGILNDDRTINRMNLSAIVFADKNKLTKLNDIVHPIVFKEWARIIAGIKRKKPDAIVISDIPLLVETGVRHYFDVVVLIYASPLTQLERLMRRSGCSEEEAKKRLDSQIPIDEKIMQADIVIDNGKSLENTQRLVDELWDALIRKNKDN